jgi:hypothetical protein
MRAERVSKAANVEPRCQHVGGLADSITCYLLLSQSGSPLEKPRIAAELWSSEP